MARLDRLLLLLGRETLFLLLLLGRHDVVVVALKVGEGRKARKIWGGQGNSVRRGSRSFRSPTPDQVNQCARNQARGVGMNQSRVDWTCRRWNDSCKLIRGGRAAALRAGRRGSGKEEEGLSSGREVAAKRPVKSAAERGRQNKWGSCGCRPLGTSL